MDRPNFVYPFIRNGFGLFLILTIVNSAALSIGVHVFARTSVSCSFEYSISESKIAESCGNCVIY